MQIIYLLFLIIKCSCSYLAIEYTKIMGSYQFNFYLGTPRQKLILSLDMTNNYTWATNYLFKNRTSTTLKQISYNSFILKYRWANLNALQYEDIASIYTNEEFKTVNFPFIYVVNDTIEGNIFEGIGAAFKFTNEDCSLIHTLYRNGLISRKSFGFYPEKDNKGILYFGAIPDELLKDKYTYSIHVLNNYTTWNIHLKKVDNYTNRSPVRIDSDEDFIKAPYSFIKYLRENPFKKYLDNQSCKYIPQDTGAQGYFYCMCRNLTDFPDISFYIDKYEIKLDHNQLFESDMSTCFFSVVANLKDEWILGTLFLKNFITQFDYEDEVIKIHSSTKYQIINDNNNALVSIILVMILSNIGSILLLIHKVFNI